MRNRDWGQSALALRRVITQRLSTGPCCLLLEVIVIFVSSSLKASSAGDGRKSRITFGSPIGSFVYLILAPFDWASVCHLARRAKTAPRVTP